MAAPNIDALHKRLASLEGSADDAPLVTFAPLPGPQTMAFESEADVVGYGGAAGGGKSYLGIGKALTRHRRIAIFRRHATEMTALVDEIAGLLGHRDGLNQVQGVWRLPGKQIEFGSVPNLGDERKFQGRAKDFLFIDEAANLLEAQVRFLMGWVRTTDPGQQTQTLLAFNPPTTAEGRWVIDFFAPWLSKKFPDPADPGELRYVATIAGKDQWMRSGEPFEHEGEVITPQSRTFIPAKISDNPFLASTGYMTTLQALPEPLRSQMLHGDFQAGIEDDPWQLIPTQWVEAAMARWTAPERKGQMLCLGADIARGGKDNTVLARRHKNDRTEYWFDELLTYPGSQTPNGPTTAGLIIAASRGRCPLLVDVIGVGSAVYDFLDEAGQYVIGVNVAEAATAADKTGRLRFANLRSQLWWQLREVLDPTNNTGIALPPDQRLLADLCAPKWELRTAAVKVEGRDDIVKRIGRSPDFASAIILTLVETGPTWEEVAGQGSETDRRAVLEFNPYDHL